MNVSSRPPFLYPPGSPLMHPPLALKHSRMFGFWVAGKTASLQASVNQTLNAASGAAMCFKVVTPYVLLTFTAVEHANSTYPSDQAKGWGKETDIVTWVMLARFDAGSDWPCGFYAYPLHIWVDDGMALINGRELFGYPKYLCQYQMPGADDPVTLFRLAAKGFEPFAPASHLAMHPLLELDATAEAGVGSTFTDVGRWRSQMLTTLQQRPDFWAANPLWQNQFDQAFDWPAAQQIFLKQFPDASGHYAVYQAVVAAPAKVDSIHSLRLLHGPYRLWLHAYDSFPLDQTLGWSLGEQLTCLGFCVDFDFTVGDGVVLVDHGAGATA